MPQPKTGISRRAATVLTAIAALATLGGWLVGSRVGKAGPKRPTPTS